MKNFKVKWLLLSIILSVASINTAWAADVCQNTIIYFDNSASNWNSNYTYFGINDSWCWYMTKITNTKLYVYKRSDGTWGGYSNIRLMADAGDWQEGERLGGYSNLSGNMDHYTDGYSNYGFGADYYYCIKPANGNNLASLSISGLGSASNGSVAVLNKTITVKAKVSENDGASYSETTSPATLTASSKKFTAYNSCASSQSLSNGTITCGYTATTTLTAPSTDPSGYIFVGWYDSDGNEKTTGKTLTIYPTANATYYAYYRKLYTISAGTTVVWDEGNTTEYSSRSHWGSVYLRRYVQGNPSSTAHDALTHLGSGSQFYKTYNSASSNIRSFMFRSTNNDNSWSDNQQSTNIFRNVSGVTLFTYCGSATSEDTRWKLDWQVTTDGKKGASGKTIYFDDTYTSWKNTEAGNREIYFNYGVDWSGGGYHRKIDFAVEKVPGTANLYKLKASSTDATNQGATNSSGQFGHDIYFQKWYVSKYYGYTNCNPITDSHVLERTEIYTDEIVSNDFTLIPTSKKSGGSGTDGSPYIWNTTKMTGHTHAVNIGSHTHGTITLSYTDESNTAQTPTESVNVAHTCIVSATATADNGYDYVSMTKGGTAYTPGTSHTVRDDVTFTATFTAHTYGIRLNKGDHGAANQSATVDFDATGLTSVTHVSANAGYQLEGYYDGSTKVLNANGSFAADNVTGYITGGKWSKYDADATLTAKFSPVALTFEGDEDGHETEWDYAGNWSPACVPTIEHDVTITKPVVVNITNAKAKSVKIYNDGTNSHTGKLTIGAGKALVVAEDIKKTEDGSTKIATTADVLHIEAGNASVANGALVWGTSGTPGAAQVDFFTLSHGEKDQNTSINQYIGTPFSDHQSILYQYYYSWIFKIKRDESTKALSWDLMGGDESMNEFEGYNLITAYAANTTYQMEGTLVSNADVTLNGSSTTKLVYSGSGGANNPNNENVLANSWVAPIKIAALDTATNFKNVYGSVYIFNACSPSAAPSGNYSTYSIKSAGDDVIPSMQSFSVYTKGGSNPSPSITLNYNDIVYTPILGGLKNAANLAPSRNKADEMQLLKVRIDGENGWADELKIYIHEDFSNAFEDCWDAYKMYGYPEAPQLYAVTTDGNMAINCVPTADNNVLGFTPGSEDNEYTFSFTYDGDEEYYLKDTKLNIETLINTEATYTFTSEAEDSEMRFIIIKRAPAVATDAETVSGDRLAVSGVQKIMHNGQLYIIRDGGIYSTDGQMVK